VRRRGGDGGGRHGVVEGGAAVAVGVRQGVAAVRGALDVEVDGRDTRARARVRGVRVDGDRARVIELAAGGTRGRGDRVLEGGGLGRGLCGLVVAGGVVGDRVEAVVAVDGFASGGRDGVVEGGAAVAVGVRQGVAAVGGALDVEVDAGDTGARGSVFCVSVDRDRAGVVELRAGGGGGRGDRVLERGALGGALGGLVVAGAVVGDRVEAVVAVDGFAAGGRDGVVEGGAAVAVGVREGVAAVGGALDVEVDA